MPDLSELIRRMFERVRLGLLSRSKSEQWGAAADRLPRVNEGRLGPIGEPRPVPPAQTGLGRILTEGQTNQQLRDILRSSTSATDIPAPIAGSADEEACKILQGHLSQGSSEVNELTRLDPTSVKPVSRRDLADADPFHPLLDFPDSKIFSVRLSLYDDTLESHALILLQPHEPPTRCLLVVCAPVGVYDPAGVAAGIAGKFREATDIDPACLATTCVDHPFLGTAPERRFPDWDYSDPNAVIECARRSTWPDPARYGTYRIVVNDDEDMTQCISPIERNRLLLFRNIEASRHSIFSPPTADEDAALAAMGSSLLPKTPDELPLPPDQWPVQPAYVEADQNQSPVEAKRIRHIIGRGMNQQPWVFVPETR